MKRGIVYCSYPSYFIQSSWGEQGRDRLGQKGTGFGTEGWRERGTKVGVLKGWELGEVVGKVTMQQCSIFCNLKRAKGRKPRKKRWKLGLQGRGDGRCGPPGGGGEGWFGPPCPPPPPPSPQPGPL